MKKEMIDFIKEFELSPFNNYKTSLKTQNSNFLKTKDARAVFTKLMSKISREFVFPDTSGILNLFSSFEEDLNKVFEKQLFFKSLNTKDNSRLLELKRPKKTWSPDYGVIVATEEEDVFVRLREKDCPVKFIVNENDISELKDADIVQVISCDNFSLILERLPQTVFINDEDEVYLERYLEMLSGWKDNLDVLKQLDLGERGNQIILEIGKILEIVDNKKTELKRENIERSLEQANLNLESQIRNMSISGDLLMSILKKEAIPENLKKAIREEISKTGYPEQIFIEDFPIKLDDRELEKLIREKEVRGFVDLAERIRLNAKTLKKAPELIRELEAYLLIYDFESGIKKFNGDDKNFAIFSDKFVIRNSLNELIEKPKPISFYLDEQNRCSILTGANSGGKTTLLEHLIQIICLSRLGLPVYGEIELVDFKEIYYFAKNKGSASKGAFETLLNQMAEIQVENKALILADEIESVTEPGVAGKIIAASANFFVIKGSYCVFATHLGSEIKDFLPERCRIDGIEAKGLDENNELIVDHNPVLGRLAHSTPELIIEKLARTSNNEYFEFLNKRMR